MKNTISIVIAIILFMLLPINGFSQQVRDRILDDIKISSEGDCKLIDIGFTFPVRYINHFPSEGGEELKIRIEPVVIGPDEQDALFKREAMSPRKKWKTHLLEVVYEGDIEGGPFVTLQFSEKVNYRVGQGADFRSIRITVFGQEGPPCDISAADDK